MGGGKGLDPSLEVGERPGVAVRIEPIAVDAGVILREAEEPGLGVARLGEARRKGKGARIRTTAARISRDIQRRSPEGRVSPNRSRHSQSRGQRDLLGEKDTATSAPDRLLCTANRKRESVASVGRRRGGVLTVDSLGILVEPSGKPDGVREREAKELAKAGFVQLS